MWNHSVCDVGTCYLHCHMETNLGLCFPKIKTSKILSPINNHKLPTNIIIECPLHITLDTADVRHTEKAQPHQPGWPTHALVSPASTTEVDRKLQSQYQLRLPRTTCVRKGVRVLLKAGPRREAESAPNIHCNYCKLLITKLIPNSQAVAVPVTVTCFYRTLLSPPLCSPPHLPFLSSSLLLSCPLPSL